MKGTLRGVTGRAVILLLLAMVVQPVYAEEALPQRGWHQEEDGRWIYLDSDGMPKTDTWILGKDKNHYYLDEEGYMATNRVIESGEHIYYVGEDGTRRANCWASQSNWDGAVCDQDVETVWYYFGANGRAKRRENRAVRLKNSSGDTRKYFFDSDGHMLSGWQRIEKSSGGYDIYYLGDENQGHAHTQWQYLEPPEDEEILADPMAEYDGYEMFYFGWGGTLERWGVTGVEGNHYAFDDNGVMITGWYPGDSPGSPDQEEDGINRYFDPQTGIMATGWLYACDPDSDEGSDPHWFYCDKKSGYVYNEGGRDSDAVLAWKRIQDQIYVFDDYGHMVTGLIGTGDQDVSDSNFADPEYDFTGAGEIGGKGTARPAGIYYLSQEEDTLGQMYRDGRRTLEVDGEQATYYFHGAGWAYTNALVEGAIYGEDGTRLESDSGWEVFTLEQDIYEKGQIGAHENMVQPRSNAQARIPAGSKVLINRSGKVKKSGKLKVDGVRYQVWDYIAYESEPDM